MKYQIDRSIPIPIARQVKGQTIRGISRGFLKPGDRLPSLRELATSLGVSYATIADVYNELAQDGILVSRPGKGTFVADLAGTDQVAPNAGRQRDLGHMVNVMVNQASMLGFQADEIRDAVLARLVGTGQESVTRYVLLVGYAAHATEYYAREIEACLQDLNVKVQPILIASLRQDVDAALAGLQPAKLAITMLMALGEVRACLEPRGFHVASIAMRLSAETRRNLASIPSHKCVGVVATEPEYLLPLAQEVTSYISPELSDASLPRAVRGQEKQIKALLAQVDVVVYNTGCEALLDWLPPGVTAIEYLHCPEPDSVSRLRPLLVV